MKGTNLSFLCVLSERNLIFMKRKFFIINIIFVLIFSTIFVCYASSDIPVWAPTSSNLVGYTNDDDNVSENLIEAVKNSSNKLNTSSNSIDTENTTSEKSSQNNKPLPKYFHKELLDIYRNFLII